MRNGFETGKNGVEKVPERATEPLASDILYRILNKISRLAGDPLGSGQRLTDEKKKKILEAIQVIIKKQNLSSSQKEKLTCELFLQLSNYTYHQLDLIIKHYDKV